MVVSAAGAEGAASTRETPPPEDEGVGSSSSYEDINSDDWEIKEHRRRGWDKVKVPLDKAPLPICKKRLHMELTPCKDCPSWTERESVKKETERWLKKLLDPSLRSPLSVPALVPRGEVPYPSCLNPHQVLQKQWG